MEGGGCALKLQQQTQYQIEGQDHWRLGTSIFQVSMNKAKWDSLPDDVKAAFRKASDEAWLKHVWRMKPHWSPKEVSNDVRPFQPAAEQGRGSPDKTYMTGEK